MTSGLGPAIGVAAAYLAVLSAPVVAPYDPTAQHREHPLAPPTGIHVVDREGRVHLRPFVLANGADGAARAYPVRFFTRASGDVEAPSSVRLFAVDPPAAIFLFGTDTLGRDQFSRLLYGGRISLGAGLLAAACALTIGVLCGCVAGFFGGWVDTAIMGASDIFMALPWLYLLLAIRAALPLTVDPGRALLAIVLVIGIAGWARPARLVRGVVSSVRSRDFVAAAAAAGASPARVLRSHVAPEAFSVALTQASILIPQYTLAEITLSFFGIGIGEPTPSWGTMIGAMLRQELSVAHWWLAAPAAALVGVSLLYHATADALHRRALTMGVTR
ncbi:MAG TPA: ABC transporter permease [Vicinamibacterales bacterium]|nr:ABC transporter permease [Vicinamibacterales bacterium]